MRIIQKLSIAFVLTTSVILAVDAGLRVQREVAVLESDRVRDHRAIGRALGAAIAAVWHTDGEGPALSALEQANLPSGRVHMRWVWLDDTPELALDPSQIRETPVGEVITGIVKRRGADGMRFTYVPLTAISDRKGAIELSESLSGQRRFTHRLVIDTVVTTLILAIVSAGLSTWLGLVIVGRPVRALSDKARRVGQGDFSGKLELRQKDELASLAQEMNMMSDRLVEAHDRVEEETNKKIHALEQLRHADRLTTVGKLASGIAHELGTPLNVVLARAQMIASCETTPAETLDYANVIVAASERMTRIIRQLLEFARRKPAEKAVLDLVPLCRRTLEMLTPLADKKEVHLEIDAKNETRALVDGGAIEQVLTNLVVNAVQATRGPGVVKVTVTEERRAPPADVGGDVSDYAVVRVADQGGGIKADDVAHVFEPFFTTKDVGEGTGLGLSVAYGIVRDHGGFIDVETAVGKGSSFGVYLPVGAA